MDVLIFVKGNYQSKQLSDFNHPSAHDLFLNIRSYKQNLKG